MDISSQGEPLHSEPWINAIRCLLPDTKGLQAWERLVTRGRWHFCLSLSLPSQFTPSSTSGPSPSQILPTSPCHLDQSLLVLLCSNHSAPLPPTQTLTLSPAALSHCEHPRRGHSQHQCLPCLAPFTVLLESFQDTVRPPPPSCCHV